MRLKRISYLMAAAAAVSIGSLALAGTSQATALIAGTGWQSDQFSALGVPSDNSPLTFTVAPGAKDTFSLTDATALGDIYTVTINGAITAMSTSTLYPTTFNNALGPAAATYGPAWLNNTFSHLQLTFAPGTYSLSVTDDCHGTCTAADVGERLDAIAIPEPATWATMLVGFGALGASMRRERRKRLEGRLA
jgi:hypothetical protein